eukprot:4086305-Pyramimonas_sp.AAC.1
MRTPSSALRAGLVEASGLAPGARLARLGILRPRTNACIVDKLQHSLCGGVWMRLEETRGSANRRRPRVAPDQ